MNSDVDASQHDRVAFQFARFSRRLRGIIFDWMIVVVVAFGALSVAVAVSNEHFSRVLGILVVIALLLYEPVLVSLTGGTLGHYFANLRVVDDRHGGNVGFLKAVARALIKGVLGWLSFLVITATRRSQALHDLWTHSTVQIRDPAKARPHHFIAERTELLDPNLPSRLRRVVVTLGYLLLIFIVYLLVQAGLLAAGVLSSGCFYYSHCSMGEGYLDIGLGLMWIATSAIGIGLGWRGKLPGARSS